MEFRKKLTKSMSTDYSPYIIEWKKKITADQKRIESLKKKYLLLAKKASRFLVKKYRVKKVILFGSLVWGKFRERSDIDIGVEGLSKEKYIRALTETEAITGATIDIKFIDELPQFLKNRINREGKVLYAKK